MIKIFITDFFIYFISYLIIYRGLMPSFFQ